MRARDATHTKLLTHWLDRLTDNNALPSTPGGRRHILKIVTVARRTSSAQVERAVCKTCCAPSNWRTRPRL